MFLDYRHTAGKKCGAYQFLHHDEVLSVGSDPLVEVSLLFCSPAVGACE